MNILVIGDTHIPFEHKNYLSFCSLIKKKYGCSCVVHVGDLVDNHSISFHEHNPDGLSPKAEMEKAKKTLSNWYKAFPSLMLCKGNHDIIANRKAISLGLPENLFKKFEEVWEIPDKWKYEWNFEIAGIRFEHGTGYSGLYPHAKARDTNRMNTVIGHCHAVSGVDFSANDKDIVFGMAVGCGIDRMKYAFWYGRDFRRKPILSCGVLIINKKKITPIIETMKL